MNKIFLDEETKQSILEKFKQFLDTTKSDEKTVSFRTTLDEKLKENEKPTIFIDPVAYCKIMMYIRDTSTEIAWHGIVERYPEQNSYYVKDVMLYPQKLAAATVVSDDDRYPQWVEALDDEVFNSMRFQGHSHVDFAATPSGVDKEYYKTILNMLPKDDYYIFMIMNKSGSFTFIIYDLLANKAYDTSDINITIRKPTDPNGIEEIIEAEKELYCTKPAEVASKYSSIYKDKDYWEDPYSEEHWWDKEDFGILPIKNAKKTKEKKRSK